MSDTDDILLRRLKEGIEAGEPVKAAGQRAMKSSMDSPAGPTRDQSCHADTGGSPDRLQARSAFHPVAEFDPKGCATISYSLVTLRRIALEAIDEPGFCRAE